MKVFNLAEELEKERKKNKELKNRVDFLIDRNDKKQEVIDKIKEYIKENACYDKDIKQCCRDLLTDECDYVLELLEEIE